MTTKAKAAATARKIKDRWKAKQWYRVIAPGMFDMTIIGETPADSPESLMGRTMEATAQDLTGDFSKMHIKMKFQIHDIRGLDAHTLFVGHDLTSDYVRRQTRRRRSKTDAVVEVRTKDGWQLRVKPMAVSEQRIQSSQRTAVRNIMRDVLRENASKSTIGEYIKLMMSGELSRAIADRGKTIVPLKRIEIRKSEVMSVGAISESTEQVPAQEAEETEAGGEDQPAPEVTEAVKTEEESEELSEEELAEEARDK